MVHLVESVSGESSAAWKMMDRSIVLEVLYDLGAETAEEQKQGHHVGAVLEFANRSYQMG